MHRSSGDDFAVTIGEADHQAPIMLCQLHEKSLHDILEGAGMSTEVEMDSPFIRAFHVLTRMATKSLGTVEVVKFQCPVCSMQQFDYIKNVVDLLKPGELILNG